MERENTPAFFRKMKLLSTKVAEDMSNVAKGRLVSEAVIEFANEWWKFRYNLKGESPLRILGPMITKQFCQGLINEGIVQEIKGLKGIIFDLHSSSISQNTSNDNHW